ncbi:hypothetical protein Tco_0507968 [Tanacetum coccineum]
MHLLRGGLEPMITEIIEKTEPKSIKEPEVTKEPEITEPKFTKEPQKDHYDLDPEPQMIEYKLPDERVAKLTRDEVVELIEKEEKVKNEMLNKYEIVKVAVKEVKEAEHVISGGKDFVKHQDPSNHVRKKRKAIELEPEVYIVGLHYNRSILEGVKFSKSRVIEGPEYGLFFTDQFNDDGTLR